jgi:hypothetical protein
MDKENLDKENLDKENLDKENLDKENLDKENLDKENLDKENLDKENLDKEILDKDIINKDILDKDIINKDILDEEILDKDIINKDILDKDILDEDIINKDILDEEILDEKILDMVRNESLPDPQKTLSDKILFEKRKRNQAYEAMNYYLGVTSMFDFCPPDVILILETTHYLAKKLNRPVDSDLLYLSYFACNSSVSELLTSSGLRKSGAKFEKAFPELYVDLRRIVPATKIQRFGLFLKNLFKSEIKQPMPYGNTSYQLLKIFETAAENAMTRFKTPIISSEILLITLMEERSTKIGALIKASFEDKTKWLAFRYELMKTTHEYESAIRNEVVKNQQYFAYLFCTQVPKSILKELMEDGNLANAVADFRESLMEEVLAKDIFASLEEDIHISMKITNTRRYSS